MEDTILTSDRGIYLRPDAIDRLTAPIRVHNLNRRQQATILGVQYGTFWRVTNRGERASDRTIADLLAAARSIAEHWGTPRLGFDDLFEVRGGGQQLAA